ncbi:MAG: hypothetical protein ACI9R3_001952 [Verrucomicrobiales bacterium]|jgi:hypothetical protein
MACAAVAQDSRNHQLGKDATGNPKLSIVVTCAFSQIPLHGYAPVRVTVDNRTNSDVDWKLSFTGKSEDDRFASRFEMESKKATSTTAEFMVPIPTRFDASPYTYDQGLDYSLKGDGFPAESGRFSEAFPGSWPTIVMSKNVAVRNEGPLGSAVNSVYSAIDSFAATFDPEWLPSDWRGYSGLDVIILTDTEWIDLQSKMPSVCKAMLEWNRLGGRLDIYSEQELQPDTLGIQGIVDNKRSLGSLNCLQWTASKFDPVEMVQRYKEISQRQSTLHGQLGTNQYLLDNLGKQSFGSWQIAVILIAFGIIVGPVNLFVFARPGRRHRLFWTTPLISILASLLLVALILYQDGTGGKGTRLIVVNLVPDETNAYVTQYQAVRTGVLFSGTFESKATYLSQVAMRDSPWAAVDSEGGLAKRYNLTGNVYGGDWFQSRREHGHYLQTVRSTRGRIEIVSDPDQAPVIVSNFGFALSRVSYIDSAGTFWLSPESVIVRPGERVTLSQSTAEAIRAIVPETVNFTSHPGHYLALTDSAGELTIETLSSITWQDSVVLYGPAIQAAR